MSQTTQAMLLDGKLRWGRISDIPKECDVIVDLRHPDELDQVELPEDGDWDVHKFPVRPQMEPEFPEEWDIFIEELLEDLKENKTIFVFDGDGTEKAVIAVWFLYVRHEKCNHHDGLEVVQEAYLNWRGREEQWWNLKVPRFARQKMWASWRLFGNSWDAFSTSLDSGRKNKRGIMRSFGSIRCSELIHPNVSAKYKILKLKGYQTIPIQNIGGTGEKWDELSIDSFRNITYNFQHLNGSIAVQHGTTLWNIWSSFYVFKDIHLDEDGKPNALFFREQEILACHVQHKLYVNADPKIVPDFIWWFGELVPFGVAMVYLFSPIYAALCEKSERYKDLLSLVKHGTSVLLIDYNAIDYRELGYTYEEYVSSCPSKWSAAHVLIGMLTGEKPWNFDGMAEIFFP